MANALGTNMQHRRYISQAVTDKEFISPEQPWHWQQGSGTSQKERARCLKEKGRIPKERGRILRERRKVRSPDLQQDSESCHHRTACDFAGASLIELAAPAQGTHNIIVPQAQKKQIIIWNGLLSRMILGKNLTGASEVHGKDSTELARGCTRGPSGRERRRPPCNSSPAGEGLGEDPEPDGDGLLPVFTAAPFAGLLAAELAAGVGDGVGFELPAGCE